MEPNGIEIGTDGKTLIVLHTSQGIRFIDKEYLRPLSDYDMDILRFYERTSTGGQLYIAVKAGMMLEAIIAPFNAVNDKFVEKLQEITKDCEIALSIKKRKEWNA